MYKDKKNLDEPVYSLYVFDFEFVQNKTIMNVNKLKEKTNI